MKPKYTDSRRYPRGYTPSHSTDITKAWADARKKIDAMKDTRAQIVRDLPHIGKRKQCG